MDFFVSRTQKRKKIVAATQQNSNATMNLVPSGLCIGDTIADVSSPVFFFPLERHS